MNGGSSSDLQAQLKDAVSQQETLGDRLMQLAADSRVETSAAGTHADPVRDLECQAASRDIKAKILDLGTRLVSSGDASNNKELLAQLQIATGLYTTLAEKYETLVVTEQLEVGSGSVVASAAVDPVAVSPKPKRNGVLGLAVGLVFGLGVAFLAEYLDNTIKSTEEAEKLFGAPVLGNIPAEQMEADEKRRLTIVERPGSRAAEAYRGLRNSIDYVNFEHDVKAVLVTSAAPGEGKSTVAANLAASLAMAGSKVVLVNCDFRRPTTDQFFDLDNQLGLSDVLADRVSLAAALQHTGDDNLTVLTPGKMPPNPSELLGSQKMIDLVARLKEDHDWVIVDSPPLLAVADAAATARWTDGVLVVTRAGVSTHPAAANARDMLDKVGARILGVVVWGLSESGGRSARLRRLLRWLLLRVLRRAAGRLGGAEHAHGRVGQRRARNTPRRGRSAGGTASRRGRADGGWASRCSSPWSSCWPWLCWCSTGCSDGAFWGRWAGCEAGDDRAVNPEALQGAPAWEPAWQNEPQHSLVTMSERRVLARSSITVSTLNAANLVVLLLLQIAIAAWFGAGKATDAYFLASAVPSLVATALVGSLNVSLIPHYVEFRERDGVEIAWRVVCTFVALLGVAVGVFVVAGMIWAPQIVSVIAPAYGVAQQALTVDLLRLSLPSVWFLCVAGVITSVHYADGSFAIPGWAVALNNVLILLMIAALYRTMGIAVCALGLTVGASLQLVLVAIPLLRQKGLHFLATMRDRRIVQIAAMALPLIAGAAVYKSDVLVGRIIAALLPAGGVSYISYANRIALMVVAVSAAGVTTVVFPRLARRVAMADHGGLGQDAVSTMKYAGLVCAMVLVPVCALAQPLVTLVLQRGAFTVADSAATAQALVGYAGFAYAGALAGVASNCLYSMKKVGRVVAIGLAGFALYVGGIIPMPSDLRNDVHVNRHLGQQVMVRMARERRVNLELRFRPCARYVLCAPELLSNRNSTSASSCTGLSWLP